VSNIIAVLSLSFLLLYLHLSHILINTFLLLCVNSAIWSEMCTVLMSVYMEMIGFLSLLVVDSNTSNMEQVM